MAKQQAVTVATCPACLTKYSGKTFPKLVMVRMDDDGKKLREVRVCSCGAYVTASKGDSIQKTTH